MLNTILGLFGKSPFAPLKAHMDVVASCVNLLPLLFEALEQGDSLLIDQIASQISDLEHQADLIKNDIRNHLPRGLFMPIERGNLLEILAIQDRIADVAQDIAVLVTIKPSLLIPVSNGIFHLFLVKNLEAFSSVHLIIQEIDRLLESSFGGVEASKVSTMVSEVAFKEHEADLLQRKLLKKLYDASEEISYGSFFLWQRIFEGTSAIANLSENLANRIRMTLESK